MKAKKEIVSDFLFNKLSKDKIDRIYELLTDKETRIIGDVIVNDSKDDINIAMTVGVYASGILFGSEYDVKIPNSPYV